MKHGPTYEFRHRKILILEATARRELGVASAYVWRPRGARAWVGSNWALFPVAFLSLFKLQFTLCNSFSQGWVGGARDAVKGSAQNGHDESLNLFLVLSRWGKLVPNTKPRDLASAGRKLIPFSRSSTTVIGLA